MNIRQLLHAIAAIAAGLAAGSLVIAGEPQAVIGIAGIIALGINVYLGTTTMGVASPGPAPTPPPAPPAAP